MSKDILEYVLEVEKKITTCDEYPQWEEIIFTPEYWDFLNWLSEHPVPASLDDYYGEIK